MTWSRALLGVYVVAALWLTMGPAPVWLVESTAAQTDVGQGRTEDLLNIVAAVPLGLLLPFAFPRLTLWRTVALVAAAAISVELVQLLLDRSPQVSDAALNASGGVLGALFAAGLRRLRPQRDAEIR